MVKSRFYRLKSKWWLILTVLLLIILAGYYWQSGPEVLVETVEKRDLVSVVEATGEVEPDDKVLIYSKLTGKVASVSVRAGDKVQKGTILARLDTAELQLEAEAAEARYRALSAQLAGITGAGREQARARLDEARAGYRVASLNYERARQLYDTGAIAKKDLEATELSLQQAQSAVIIAEQDLRKLQGGSEVQALKAQVDEARAHLDLARKNLQTAVITAPVTGTVFYCDIEPGEYVTAGTRLFMLGTPAKMVVKTYILQSDISRVKAGQTAHLRGEALGTRQIEGKVSYIAPAAEKVVSSLGVEQTKILTEIIPRQPGLLRPGSKVDVSIITDRRSGVLTVPGTAIDTDDGQQVLVVKRGQAVAKRVKTGISDGKYVEIIKGLAAGEQVILEPDKVKPGQKVQPRA